MKSRLPEYPVAMTGLPSSIASAIVMPKPSERCRETYASQLCISRVRSGAET